ncbi:MAG: rhodanese-like domain-containing protein [Finegoldia sp.]|nr:rhodanese-like domain-containing protein [Finegoldia sp.]
MKNTISKKFTLLLSTLALAVFVFVGCSSSDNKQAETTTEQTTDQAQTSEGQTEETTETTEESSAAPANDSKEITDAIAKQDEIDKIIEEAAKKVKADDANKDREVFVTADYVNDVISGKKDVGKYVVAEVAWGEAKDSPDYLTKHIPGAIHINTDSIEEGPIWNLKSPEEIKKAFLDYGVDKDTTLIIYGPDTGAHRVAFTALYAGVNHVKVLDGGLKAWEAKGYETQAEEVKAEKAGDFGIEVPANPQYLLTINQVSEKLKDPNFQLISIRSEKEWLGTESGYSYIPRAGEIKGALWGKSGSDNSDMSFYQNEDGTNKAWDEITKMWADQGISTDKDLSFYCGTGWRATLPWLMAYQEGLNPTLYDGGWNEWQMHDDKEVQVGDPKASDVQNTTVKELPTDKATLQ